MVSPLPRVATLDRGFGSLPPQPLSHQDNESVSLQVLPTACPCREGEHVIRLWPIYPPLFHNNVRQLSTLPAVHTVILSSEIPVRSHCHSRSQVTCPNKHFSNKPFLSYFMLPNNF